jgi:hypothetical protein
MTAAARLRRAPAGAPAAATALAAAAPVSTEAIIVENFLKGLFERGDTSVVARYVHADYIQHWRR